MNVKITNHVKQLYYRVYKVMTNKTQYVAALSILINLVFISFYFFYTSTTPSSDLSVVPTSLGPDLITTQAWKEYTETITYFCSQLLHSTDYYGLIDEHNLDYKVRQLIINYPGWLDYYRKYRTRVWHGFENNRLEGNKTFPDYQPESSELIEHALSTQSS